MSVARGVMNQCSQTKISRGFPLIVDDAGYGNNTTFLLELEKRRLKYLGGLAKNRKVIIATEANQPQEIRLDKLAQSLPVEAIACDSTQSRSAENRLGGDC